MPSDFIMLHKIDMLTCLHEKLKICTGTHYTVHAEAISKEKVNRNVALNFLPSSFLHDTKLLHGSIESSDPKILAIHSQKYRHHRSAIKYDFNFNINTLY